MPLQQELHGDTLLLRYVEASEATDLRFRIETSRDLKTWEPAVLESTSRIDQGTMTRVTVQVSIRDNGGFYRLVVEER